MKTINYNDWALHNKLKTSILIEPSAETNYLIGKFYDYNSFKLALFYYRLEGNVLYGARFNERY
ncbi:hypothetical protein MaLMM01_gp137 [uncultured phage]|nr:hypothetical protein MaLMM01_gp137 [uncultured phage]